MRSPTGLPSKGRVRESADLPQGGAPREGACERGALTAKSDLVSSFAKGYPLMQHIRAVLIAR